MSSFAFGSHDLSKTIGLANANHKILVEIVNEVIGNGGPSGVFNTLQELRDRYPKGARGVFLVTSNGHWYYWNGSLWDDGGVYQATEVPNGSITKQKLTNELQSSINAIPSIQDNANQAKLEITSHKSSDQAHNSQSITYSGDVYGANNVQAAINSLKQEISRILSHNGDGTKDTELIAARGASSTLGGRLDLSDAKISSIAINAIEYGVVMNDGSYDNTNNVQDALDFLESQGGGKLVFSSGQDYYFKGTIYIPEGVTIEAAGIPVRIYSDTPATRFFHVPDSPSDFIKLTTPIRDYHYGVGIKNINIIGNDNSLIGVDMTGSSYSVFENVNIRAFETNLLIDYGMFNMYNNVTSVLYRKYGMHLVNVVGITTTQRFQNCYFGQTYVRAGSGIPAFLTAIPIKIDSYSVTDCVFDKCTIESTEKGVHIGTRNTVRFIEPYIESLPVSDTDYMFTLGFLDPGEVLPPAPFFKGFTSITGGRLLGAAFISYDKVGTGFINVDYADSVVVNGTYYLNTREVLTFTSNTTGVAFRDTVSYTIFNDLEKIRSPKVTIDNCKVTTGVILNEKNRQDFVGSGNSRYTILNEFESTNGELVFRNQANQRPFKLDQAGNILHQFSGNPLSVGRSDIYGSVPRPTTTGFTGGIVEWVETTDSIPQKYVYQVDGKIYNAIPRRGGTSSRPSNATALDGQQYYDTTLKKPIWFDATNLQWRDAMGTVV